MEGDGAGYIFEDGVDGDDVEGIEVSEFNFDGGFFDQFLANEDTDGDTDEVSIFKFGSGLDIAIIEECFAMILGEFVIDLEGNFLLLWVIKIDWSDNDLEWSDSHGPDDTILVMVVFDSSGKDTVNTNTIAAHGRELIFAILIGIGDIVGFGIFFSKFKDMGEFDGLVDLEW